MSQHEEKRVSTGIAGLDEVLCGGLLAGRSYLVRGRPGTGKTTLGMHFLTAGAALGESVLFITLAEPESSLRQNYARQGFDLNGISFLDMSPTSTYFSEVQTYDIFSPAEVEREPLTNRIVETVQALRPARVFLDPLTQFRYLASDIFQFRKQVLSFLRFIMEQGATILFTSESGGETPDDDLQFMADGIVELSFDQHGRNVSIAKIRGSNFRGRRHSMRLCGAGMEVFPRLIPETHRVRVAPEVIPSGLADLDKLLNGGLERGTVTFLTGPTGVGKTTLGLQFMKEAVARGERSVLFSFEEEIEIMLRRAESIGIGARAMIAEGNLLMQKVEPLEFTPDEFARLVRRQVEQEKARVVMVDSVAGYRLCMRGDDLVSHLHALSKYLQNMGVVVLLITETAQLTGDFRVTDYEISYLADNIVFLRYLEIHGQLRKAIGVLKKRLSNFEKTLREFEITGAGIRIGEPLTHLRGILSGSPWWSQVEGQT